MPLRQLFLGQTQVVQDDFTFDMCEAFLAANIPWTKIENPKFNSFLEKYCKRKIPNESSLRKNYLNKCYDSVSFIKLKQYHYLNFPFLYTANTEDSGQYWYK
jgi:alpha-L-arabinofuranosidase